MRKMRVPLTAALVAVFMLGALPARADEAVVPIAISAPSDRDYARGLAVATEWSAAEGVELTPYPVADCSPLDGILVLCFRPGPGVYSPTETGGIAYAPIRADSLGKIQHIKDECRERKHRQRCVRRQVALLVERPLHTTACHEVGHGLGLGHNTRKTSCLGFGWAPDAIDLAGVSSLHPATP